MVQGMLLLLLQLLGLAVERMIVLGMVLLLLLAVIAGWTRAVLLWGKRRRRVVVIWKAISRENGFIYLYL